MKKEKKCRDCLHHDGMICRFHRAHIKGESGACGLIKVRGIVRVLLRRTQGLRKRRG